MEMKTIEIKKNDGTPLTVGDIGEDKIVELKYDSEKSEMVVESVRELTKEEHEQAGFNWAIQVIDNLLDCYEDECPDASPYIEEIRERIDDELEIMIADS